ncbi:hypothetical protein SeMB42_g04984 [Synchytrium endobioticum]|uniref:DNA mismatch repair proteins mutS family domain-containing protein n=1 Tax=Synchytrium endobioticum TaxID=286115 RepID=A0A507CUN9_9FUNG|nr:hypothetical protein SeMB42_g04984 [Synchytrium endobioticum]
MFLEDKGTNLDVSKYLQSAEFLTRTETMTVPSNSSNCHVQPSTIAKTLLLQLCIAVIMAQLGCHLLAESCALTPFDRVFRRIDAYDNWKYPVSLAKLL